MPFCLTASPSTLETDMATFPIIGLDNGIVNLHYAKDDSTHIYSKSVNQMQSEYISFDSDSQLKTENFGFVNWLNLYYGTLKYSKELEKYADAHI